MQRQDLDSDVLSTHLARASEVGPVLPARHASQIALYAVAVFSSAFLIFLIQPMVARRILPWYGGVPAVWTLCLAFYQTSLFVGYAYAHLLTRLVAPTIQIGIHAVAIALAIASLPVLPSTPPDLAGNADPSAPLLGILASNVAPPFLVLASTGPLVQAWLARAYPAVSPYPLYAVSNFGSFLALFAYPFVIEPRLSLSSAESLWIGAFGVTVVLVLACALPMVRRRGTNSAAATPERSESSASPGASDTAMWIALSATGVVLLMAVTNKLCLDVASIPFLWLIPLATYLATFIVAFASDRAYRRAPFAAATVASFLATRALAIDDWVVHQVLAYSALLFGTCMMLHGELYRARPTPEWLTRFYLSVSAGGAIGGIFVGLVAPAVFDDYLELPIGFCLAAALVLSRCARDPKSFLYLGAPRWHWVIAAPLMLAFAGYFIELELRANPLQIHQERSFFGVLRIDESRDGAWPQRMLTNGTTVHGVQFTRGKTRRLPTSYYGRATGLGLVFTSRPPRDPWKVGVVGLGTGTIAAYGRKGDSIRFYEIDPIVARLAGPDGHFSFIDESQAEIEIVLGDARRSIESEQRRGGSQGFDLLVLDAFTSDSIPVHLMTREAFGHYFEALAPDGLIAAHVSNRHFELRGLVSRMAAELQAHSLQIQTATIPDLQTGQSDWVLIARTAERLARLRIPIEKRLRALKLSQDSAQIRRGSDVSLEGFPVWTDDYSDLVSVIR